MSFKFMKTKSFWLFAVAMVLSTYVGMQVKPNYIIEKIALDVQQDVDGTYFYKIKNKKKLITVLSMDEAVLNSETFDYQNYDPKTSNLEANEKGEIGEYVYSQKTGTYYHMILKKHFRFWSFIPIILAVALAWITKEPISSLMAGVMSGALILGVYDLTDGILLKTFMSKNAAGVLILYLWLLGGLMGIWTKTGATVAFAQYMTKHFVRGPKSAKFVAWALGVVFFQGGTVSTILVGTTVKPLSDQEKISHEELSYIVDSTAAPIASLIPFNAWPLYIQAFLYVSGISWLATESDRLKFFFQSIPFSFYAIFAVFGTFLFSIDKLPFLGKRMKNAIKRARTTGKLDADDASPLSSKELQTSNTPSYYNSSLLDFLVPLTVLIFTAIFTFVIYGSPNVRWAFAFALASAMVLAMFKGMKLKDLIAGISSGTKGVVFGTIILILAITIGGLSREVGGASYLVELLRDTMPFWLLPLTLQALTMIISFSTGTSWGTYAVTFPLAMPLAWAIAQSNGLAHPKIFMMIVFATVLNGSVYGDQCSPISDTTVVTSMSTGCDLMDHVKTQLPQATIFAVVSAILWMAATLIIA